MPERLAHSSIKHDLIRQYIRDYIAILTNVPKRSKLRLTLFDGFAGGGLFSENGVLVPGTSLILAEEVMRAKQEFGDSRNIEFDIDLWAVEKNKKNFDQLKATIEDSDFYENFPGRIHLRNCSYEVALRESIQRMLKIQNTAGRSIFLLDQTGFGQVDFDHVRSIFRQLKYPEVIMTMSVSWLVDLATDNSAFLKKVSSLGIHECDLRELLQSKQQQASRYGGQKWVRKYITEHIQAAYNTCFFLKSRPANKDIWLLHFANNWRARDAMMEVHYKFANKTHFYGKAGFEMLGFDKNSSIQQSEMFNFTKTDGENSSIAMLEDIPRSLIDRGGANGISLGELFDRELNDATTTLRQFEMGAVLARNNKVLEILTADGRPRPHARWLRRDDVLKIPDQKSFWTNLD